MPDYNPVHQVSDISTVYSRVNQDALASVIRLARAAIPCQQIVLWLTQRASSDLQIAAAHDLTEAASAGNSFHRQAALQVVQQNHVWRWPTVDKAVSSPPEIEGAILIVPVLVEHTPTAALEFVRSSDSPGFGESEQGLAEAAANQIALIFQNQEHVVTLSDYRAQLAQPREYPSEDLLAIISHELRTPLTTILGYAKLLASKPEAKLERRARWANFILEKAYLLAHMVDEFLDLSYLSTGQFALDKASTDLAQLTQQVCREMATASNSHTIEVSYREAVPPALVDADRLAQSLGCLLSNALKYSPRGGKIEVELERRGNDVRISVTDHGIGIEPEHLQRIFEPFYRVDNSLTRRIYGTGLGLTIARRLVKAHDGQIEVQSVPTQGSTFTITLPLESSHQAK